MFGEVLGNLGKDVASGGRCHLTVALGGTRTEKRGDSRVRLEVGDNRAKVGFEVSELDAEVIVHGTLGVVGSKLSVAREVTDALLVSDTGATCHVLERVADTDNRKHQQVSTVFDGCLLILFEGELKFPCHIRVDVLMS